MKPRRKPRKPYEKRVDVRPYQRLMRFLRWMTPTLAPTDVLRMLPESDAWLTTHVSDHADNLEEALRYAQNVPEQRACLTTLAELVPYVVVGKWSWPTPLKFAADLPENFKRFFGHFLQQGSERILRQEIGTKRTDIVKSLRWALPRKPPAFGEAVLLKGTTPTIKSLCQLAEDVREPLHRIVEKGPRFAYRPIAQQIQGRVVRTFTWVQEIGQDVQFRFEDTIAGNDFRAHCFWLVARILAEGHAWRIAPCEQCGRVFLKTKQDPPERPGRFCSEQCRRGWHNPRRPKNGRLNGEA